MSLKVKITGTPAEIAEKGPELLKAVARELAKHSPECLVLEKALELEHFAILDHKLAKAHQSQRVFPSDNPKVQNDTAGPSLSMWHGAYSSRAGDRNVGTGSTGPNLLFQAPLPGPHARTMPETRFKQLEQYIEERDEGRAAARRKRGDQKVENLQIATHTRQVMPFENWEERAHIDFVVRKEAPVKRAQLLQQVEARHQTSEGAPGRVAKDNGSTAADYVGGAGIG